MKKTIAIIALSAIMFHANSIFGQKLKSFEDSISYALGATMAEQLKPANLEEGFVNYKILIKGFEAAYEGEDVKIDVETSMKMLQDFFQKVEEKNAEASKDEGKKFLEENKTREGVVTTESGLQYEILKEGTGSSPKATDKVTVHYTGTLIDGTVFDSSVERGEPVTFALNQVIPGWTEALQLMKVGGKWKIYLPSDLGYGERGVGDLIKPYSTLIFEVELLGIGE